MVTWNNITIYIPLTFKLSGSWWWLYNNNVCTQCHWTIHWKMIMVKYKFYVMYILPQQNIGIKRAIGHISFVLKTAHAIFKKNDRINQVLEIPLLPRVPSKNCAFMNVPLISLLYPHSYFRIIWRLREYILWYCFMSPCIFI